MNRLDELENRSIYIIREAYYRFKDIAILWSGGKDSTTALWLCRKAFYGRMPFPAVHLDTTQKLEEIYEFRDRLAKEWALNLVIARNDDALARGVHCGMDKQLTCCQELKTNALKQVIERKGFKAILVGIRRDEHGIRAKERYFSPRDRHFSWDYANQPMELWDHFKNRADDETHLRIHPMLHWTEEDVWNYIMREKIPVVGLYFSKNGKRYRSIGCKPACVAIQSEAKTVEEIIQELKTTTVSERAGRLQDKESTHVMQKLRSLGYM